MLMHLGYKYVGTSVDVWLERFDRSHRKFVGDGLFEGFVDNRIDLAEHIEQNLFFINGRLHRIEMRLHESATNTIDDGNCSWVGYIDASWTGANDGAILLMKLIVFLWRLAIPYKEEAPELRITSPEWTWNFGESWMVNVAEVENERKDKQRKKEVRGEDVGKHIDILRR
jgi:hypothetical protein